MLIELKSFTLPAGHTLRKYGDRVQDRTHLLFWDPDRSLVLVMPKKVGHLDEPVKVFSVDGAAWVPKDDAETIEYLGGAPAKKRRTKAEAAE